MCISSRPPSKSSTQSRRSLRCHNQKLGIDHVWSAVQWDGRSSPSTPGQLFTCNRVITGHVNVCDAANGGSGLATRLFSSTRRFAVEQGCVGWLIVDAPDWAASSDSSNWEPPIRRRKRHSAVPIGGPRPGPSALLSADNASLAFLKIEE